MTVNKSEVREGLPNGFPSPTSEGGRPVNGPAAGYGNSNNLKDDGSNGYYWSSTPNSDNPNNAWRLNFNANGFNGNSNNRYNGYPVRPVRELATVPADGDSHRLLEDLYRAYLSARAHKRGKEYQVRFEMNQERELVKLRDELLTRTYEPRPSSCFIVHDPKMREVFAAAFRDRIVHHLFYNYTHEAFERTFIADSYSCVVGRGTHYGIERLKRHIRSCSRNWSRDAYVLKLDIRGYFMHIDREILLARCREILAKARARRGDAAFGGASAGFVDYLLEKICLLDPLEDCRVIGDREEWRKLPKDKSLFRSEKGCGLPIGNLSSQLFSNVYLGMLDEYVKRELKVRHYGRYVDDVFIVAETKDELKALIGPIRSFLRERLRLELSERKTRISAVRHGVEFLGAFVKPFRTYVSGRTLQRIRRHVNSVTARMRPARAQAIVNSSLGVLSHYESFCVRRVLVAKSRLGELGRVSEDGLRFYPDALDWALRRKSDRGSE